MMEDKLPKSLSCLLSHDKQTGLWVNHCLDFDLVTSGTSEDEAWSSMKSVLRVHVESCFSDGFLPGLSKKADLDAWVAFAEQWMLGNYRSEKIKFDLKRNDHLVSGLWMKGVEVESFPSRVRASS